MTRRQQRQLSMAVVAVALAAWHWWLFLAFVWLWVVIGVPIVLKARQIVAQRQECARLIEDCTDQHRAWLEGGTEDELAFFGKFTPTPPPWVTYVDGPAPVQSFPLPFHARACDCDRCSTARAVA